MSRTSGISRSLPVYEFLESRLLLAADLPAEEPALLSVGSPVSLVSAESEISPDTSQLPSKKIAKLLWRGQEVLAYQGRWIIRVDVPQRADLGSQLSSLGLKLVRRLGQNGLFMVEAPEAATFEKLSASLKVLPGFQYVEPDALVSIQSQKSDYLYPDDPAFSREWGFNTILGKKHGLLDPDIDAPEAWAVTTGSHDVVVGIVDTGIDYNHPDLAANIWTNPNEIAGDGIDNDGNGYVDDIHGWDFFNNDNDPMDDYGHGTIVSGVVGAVGNNGLGVAGVNWSVQMMGLKMMGSQGYGSWSAAVEAINYATMMRRDFGINIGVTNNSYSGGWSDAMAAAIEANRDAGMLFVAAAGNSHSNLDTTPSCPAGLPLENIISVGSTEFDGALALYSNYGPTSVDLCAPGNSYSTAWQNRYTYASGTSIASPFVAGVAALAWSHAPAATYQQVRDAIFKGVEHLDSLAGTTVTGGLLNALGTLKCLKGSLSTVKKSAAAPATDAASANAKPSGPAGAVVAQTLVTAGEPQREYSAGESVSPLTWQNPDTPKEDAQKQAASPDTAKRVVTLLTQRSKLAQLDQAGDTDLFSLVQPVMA